MVRYLVYSKAVRLSESTLHDSESRDTPRTLEFCRIRLRVCRMALPLDAANPALLTFRRRR
jgi:hypothetical protein